MKTDDLSKKIYEGYGIAGSGKEYFSKFAAELDAVDKREFLAFNFRNFDAKYCFDLLLCRSDLWEAFSAADWRTTMLLVGERPSNPKPFDDLGNFADIQFLCKYLELDAVSFFINSEEISQTDKLSTLEYVRTNLIFFINDREDYEDLEEGYRDSYYSCNPEKLFLIKNRFLKDSSFKEFPNDTGSARSYIDDLTALISLNRP